MVNQDERRAKKFLIDDFYKNKEKSLIMSVTEDRFSPTLSFSAFERKWIKFLTEKSRDGLVENIVNEFIKRYEEF
jgi:hypothetical protein